MSCEYISREINDSVGEPKLFTTRQLSASKSLDLYVELMNKVGTSVLPLINNDYTFGDIITVMRANQDNKIVVELMKRTICLATIEGKEITNAMYDLHYDGDLMLACKVFAFVLEANYKDFFKQGRDLNELRRSEAAAISAMAEPKNSNEAKT